MSRQDTVENDEYINLLRPLHVRTPLIESPSMSKGWDKQVFLKMENLQPINSFKIRGIGLLCQKMKKKGKKHFVSSSGGNAGYAAAYAGKRLGVETTVFVPARKHSEVIKKIEIEGAEVIPGGKEWDDADKAARKFKKDKGKEAAYISPFKHHCIWEGHSTLVDEIVEDIGKPDVIVLSVGGGGLLCGVIKGLEKNEINDVPIVAVETELTASLAASLDAKEWKELEKTNGVATSLGARKVAKKAFDWSVKYKVKSLKVTDDQAKEACVRFYDEHEALVEAACGASLSVVYQRDAVFEKAKRIVVIVCGGIVIDLETLQNWRIELQTKGKK
jgi:L-serine/L-threonine ammonia-lyase